MAGTVSVLFARKDSVYKTLGVDVWDLDRNALLWPGGNPVVAHPPCRLWGNLRRFSTAPESERDLAIYAVNQVRAWGGVLEHPLGSILWKEMGLPLYGNRDRWGGFTLGVNQHWWGHKAEKATWLYICGLSLVAVPSIPLRLDLPSHVIETRVKGVSRRPSVTKAEREYTPQAFASWLIDLASRCRV
jgi:hypothetical protein